MQNATSAAVSSDRPIAPVSDSKREFWAVGLVLGALWGVLCWHLSAEWSVNEQYGYGWFVAPFALFLFWLRWEDRPAPERTKEKGERRKQAVGVAIGVVALLLLFPIRLFEIANPDWRPFSWAHTAAVATLTLLFIWCAGGRPWLRHFAFPIAFFFVAVPWVTPIEEPIVQGLMRIVAAVATEALNLCGIPARLEGSLIRVNTGLVGVNEACSGVRSLQTSLMIGLLFGEIKRLATARRIILVIAALAVAVAANFGRAFFLVWIAATQGPEAVASWHDMVGYTIVVLVFASSLALAALLGRKVESRKVKVERVGDQKFATANPSFGGSEVRDRPNHFLLSPFYFLLCLLWLLLVEIGVEAWYRAHERDLVPRPQWTVRWPEGSPDFREIEMDEKVKGTLRFDEGREASWRVSLEELSEVTTINRSLSKNPLARCLLFFFRWKPGHNSAVLANLHRPDVCLPAAGWQQIADYGMRIYPVSASLSLPFRHFAFSSPTPQSGVPQLAHTFFCLWEDRGVPGGNFTPETLAMVGRPTEWSRTERVRLVRQGRRNLGQQMMQFILLSPKELGAEEVEAKFAAMVPELVEESRK